jgi:hypothetical protein
VRQSGALGLVALLIFTGLPLTSLAEPETQDHIDYQTISLLGGSAWVSEDVLASAGDRFLSFQAPPVFTRTQEALADPGLVPGDQGDQEDQEVLINERQVTDYSYMEKDYTGTIHVENVDAPSDEWLCVCDAVFVMANENGMAPLSDRLIFLRHSTNVWFDNITLYGGGLGLDNSEHIIISNSLFVDSGGILSDFGLGRVPSNHGLIHNITMILQRGPLTFYNTPHREVGDLLGTDDPMCWPHDTNPTCGLASGIQFRGGENWTVEWSYLHGNMILGTFSAPGLKSITLRHNTLIDTGSLSTGHGTNEISWNLIRGNHARGNLDTRGATETEIHNNTIIRPQKIDHRQITAHAPALTIINCEYCKLRDNDFIGYARYQYGPDPAVDKIGEPVARLFDNLDFDDLIDASDNYWGTLHDPREPEDMFIWTDDRVNLVLDSWHTTPTHPVPPLALTLDPRDPPYWVDRIMENPPEPRPPV